MNKCAKKRFEERSAEHVLRVTDEEYNRIMKNADRSEEEIEQSLQSLRNWLRKEPHLPDTEDDRILFSMLLLSKWSVERVKAKLDACYTYKTISPELYTDNEPLKPNMQTIIANNILLPLPKLTDDCSRVFLFKTSADLEGFNHLDCLRFFMLGMELILQYDYACRTHVVIDFGAFSFGHMKLMSPTMLVKNVTFFASVFPNSMKGMHFLNVPPFTHSLIQLLKTTIKNKLAERVHIHKDMDALHSFISKTVLPVEYGGTERPLLEVYADWRKFLENHNDWIRERSQIKSNESLRIGKMPDAGIYGPEGSFRKLNVD